VKPPNLGIYDWPGLKGDLSLSILETLPLAAMSTARIQRIKELLIRVDALQGFDKPRT
jgi:hypothetical protein